jgi:hypothetical protein
MSNSLVKIKPMTAFDWRAHLRVHPAAELFPMMSETELKGLAENIEMNGLVDPIVIWINQQENDVRQLLDGRNRLDAMALAGILGIDDHGLYNVKTGELISQTVRANGDPYEIALALNVHRRHLNAEQRRELIAKVLKAKPEASNRQIAKQVKADDKTVAKVRTELEATAEIPQLKKTKGKDGKARPAKAKKKPTSTTVSPAPIKAAEPEVKPAVVTVPAKTTESILIRIADLARDCRGLLAHPEQNANEIRKKLSQIIKLSDPNSKGHARANDAAKSNAKLDQKLFRRAMALEGGNDAPAPITGNDVNTEQSAEERRAFYAAAEEVSADPKKDGIPVFLQTQNTGDAA